MGGSEKMLELHLLPAFWGIEAIGHFSSEKSRMIRPSVNVGFRPQAEQAEPSWHNSITFHLC